MQHLVTKLHSSVYGGTCLLHRVIMATSHVNVSLLESHLSTNAVIPDDCPYETIGGSGATIVRRPSLSLSLNMLSCVPERGLLQVNRSYNSSPVESELSSGRKSVSESIVRWQEDEVISWLDETGFGEYADIFRNHSIRTGRLLLTLEESHLLEMGINSVGHRLEIMDALNHLRQDAGLVDRSKLVGIKTLMKQLDIARDEEMQHRYPKRIILVRHGESQGNVDHTIYQSTPDRYLELTEKGRTQAYAAGIELKELLHEESVTFYVSPFTRSKHTFEQIRKCFHDEQVLQVRTDPRIREQEWGNFQDPAKMPEIIAERRTIGSFYYRFPTGESGADVYDRVSTFLETLYRDMEKGGCGQNAVIVSHGLFCRLFLTRYYHWSIDKFHKLWNFKNGQYAIMELLPSGSYRLVSELKSNP